MGRRIYLFGIPQARLITYLSSSKLCAQLKHNRLRVWYGLCNIGFYHALVAMDGPIRIKNLSLLEDNMKYRVSYHINVANRICSFLYYFHYFLLFKWKSHVIWVIQTEFHWQNKIIMARKQLLLDWNKLGMDSGKQVLIPMQAG